MAQLVGLEPPFPHLRNGDASGTSHRAERTVREFRRAGSAGPWHPRSERSMPAVVSATAAGLSRGRAGVAGLGETASLPCS